jgi:uncharacterized protein
VSRGKPAGPSPKGELAATLAVKVVVRASRDAVAGYSEGVLRVRVAAPAVEGRANEALVRFLSDVIRVPRSNVVIAAGETGRRKIVRIAGISRAELFRRLGITVPTEDP